jgi:Holliday junction resolvase
MRRAAKRDESEAAIVDALLRAGWSVERWSQRDCPDLVLGRRGINVLAEVKTGKKTLRAGQAKWHREWRGRVIVLRTVEEALAL